VLERIDPAVDRLVAHIEDHSDYVQPEVAAVGSGHDDGAEHAEEGE
jgi:hypothetical protein